MSVTGKQPEVRPVGIFFGVDRVVAVVRAAVAAGSLGRGQRLLVAARQGQEELGGQTSGAHHQLRQH